MILSLSGLAVITKNYQYFLTKKAKHCHHFLICLPSFIIATILNNCKIHILCIEIEIPDSNCVKKLSCSVYILGVSLLAKAPVLKTS